jgi:hypothetical protein
MTTGYCRLTTDNKEKPMFTQAKINPPEFPPNLEWLNTPHPLTLADLRGKVVMLEFFTYG